MHIRVFNYLLTPAYQIASDYALVHLFGKSENKEGNIFKPKMQTNNHSKCAKRTPTFKDKFIIYIYKS